MKRMTMPAEPQSINQHQIHALRSSGLSNFRRKKLGHIKPRYIADRVSLWLYQRRNIDKPWLTRHMVNCLENWLNSNDVGHEWGSGRSTIWFAKRTKYLTSVEHHPSWANSVRAMLKRDSLSQKVGYHLISRESEQDSNMHYVESVNTHSDQSLDYCLVDGILRDHCALACLPKLKPGGILLLDNVNWFIPREPSSRSPNSRGFVDGFASDTWRDLFDKIQSWRSIWTSDGVTDTALWIKP